MWLLCRRIIDGLFRWSNCGNGGTWAETELEKTLLSRGAELAVTLQQANPALPDDVAKRYAAFITQLNDRKRFRFAWGYLEEALEWKEGGDKS